MHPAPAPTTTISAVADAYVDAAAPKQRFGTTTTLLAGESPTRDSYIRFDLTAVAAPITGVTLILSGPASVTGFEVRATDDSNWNERSITYSNAPEVGGGTRVLVGACRGGHEARRPRPHRRDSWPTDDGRAQEPGDAGVVVREPGGRRHRSTARTAERGRHRTGGHADVAFERERNQPIAADVRRRRRDGRRGFRDGDGERVCGGSATGTPVQTLPTTASAGAWSAPASTLAEGVYTAQAQQIDDAGNVGRSAANTFTVDTTAPTLTLTSPANAALLNTRTPVLSGAAGSAAGDSSVVTVRIYAAPPRAARRSRR